MLRSVSLTFRSPISGARAARRLRPVWLAAGILFLSACPNLDPPVYYQADFEGCTGTCGWEISGPGTASIVATIHPGEHGLRLEGDITVTHAFDRPIDEASSITWVADGAVQITAVISDADADVGAVVTPAPPRVDEDGDPVIEEVDGGFRPYNGGFGSPIQTTLRSLSITHHAESPPATVDVVQVLGLNTNPGCY